MTAMTLSAPAFWDRIARKYAKSPINDVPAYETTLARTRAYLRREDRVLELGCGTASTAIRLAPEVGHITASDISAEMVEIGRERVWEASAKNIENVQGVLGDPGLDGSYDAILAFNLLHLVPDINATVARAFDQVTPGGHFISKTACLASGGWYLRPLVAVMRLVHRAPPVRFLSVTELERIIVAAGFEIVETGDYPQKPPSHFIVARKP